MATIKKSNKKKIIIPVCIVLVIALIAGSVFAVSANNKAVTVSLSEIKTGEIVEDVNATGKITSGASKEFKAGTVAQCNNVYVKVGDYVKKGQKLATFSTDELDTQIASLEASYSDASSAYNNALNSQAESIRKVNAINKQIAPLEKKVAKLQKNKTNTTKYKGATTKKVSTTKKAEVSTTRRSIFTTTKKSSTTNASGSSSRRNLTSVTNSSAATSGDSGSSTRVSPTITMPTITTTDRTDIQTELEKVVKSLQDLADTINKLSDDVTTTNAITREVMNSIAKEMEKGNFSPDTISKAAGQAMSDAIKSGLIDETKLVIESGVAVVMVEGAVKSVDWAGMGKSIAGSANATLASAELQLTALYAQRELYSLGASGTTLNAQKQAMNATKNALDTLRKSQEQLQAGWVSTIDGIVTECSVKSGQQTSALDTGIKVENLDKMAVTISLGEYDVHKVSVGMKANITTAYGKYSGEIISIAPTATGSSGSSVLDSVGSMAGVSGLSSLTEKGAGVECVVSVDSPDDNIIVGFEASVDIKTGTYSDIPTVPIESIVLEKDGSYVYLYDEATETVTKTKIEVGAHSDFAYEVKSGLKVGDKIVSTPGQDYEEDTFKVKVK
ncbi:MAG: efflux RND transporter periplasmic adaptor subunit [Eubacterium sp.]|nr:efflux RND transporter periplasmic adaptor subunit [Eubacterium sp.]